MTNPQFVEEKPLCLADVKAAISQIESRDKDLNYLTTKSKEYLETFIPIASDKKEKLHKKLVALGLTRLKEEHIVKIIDFLPKDVNELKVALQAYPLSMPKKDQDAIVEAIKEHLA